MMTLRRSGLIILTLLLPGCSELGMCKEESLSSRDSPDGRYWAEIVSADCAATSPARWVVLHQAEGTFKGHKTVAVFDDSAGDANISVRWEDETHLVIRARGAKPWSFSPNWHGVHVADR